MEGSMTLPSATTTNRIALLLSTQAALGPVLLRRERVDADADSEAVFPARTERDTLDDDDEIAVFGAGGPGYAPPKIEDARKDARQDPALRK
ncbi:hypothetical protein CP532_3628 [Ophiocordyceps camponoti-leonardi (nom. inval.)]|nr:hypothetical protein CP532_3628 [Ophiocordyceps camponoti-leonardi (nom. inval.)]